MIWFDWFSLSLNSFTMQSFPLSCNPFPFHLILSPFMQSFSLSFNPFTFHAILFPFILSFPLSLSQCPLYSIHSLYSWSIFHTFNSFFFCLIHSSCIQPLLLLYTISFYSIYSFSFNTFFFHSILFPIIQYIPHLVNTLLQNVFFNLFLSRYNPVSLIY